MKELRIPGWIYFVPDNSIPKYSQDKVGKWMYFYRDEDGFEFTKKMCMKAIEAGVTLESKIADNKYQGVACFYAEADDLKVQKRIIEFFIQNKMIRKTKAGKFYDISFKLDSQTDANQYGGDYTPELKLSEFINLYTGEWIR